MYNVRDDDYINSVVSQRIEFVNPFLGVGAKIDLYNREFSCDNLPLGYTKKFKELPSLIPDEGQTSPLLKPYRPRYLLEWELLISIDKYKRILSFNADFESIAEEMLVSGIIGSNIIGELHLHLYDYRVKDLRTLNFSKYSIIFTGIELPEETYFSENKVLVRITGETISTIGLAPTQEDLPLDTPFEYDYNIGL